MKNSKAFRSLLPGIGIEDQIYFLPFYSITSEGRSIIASLDENGCHFCAGEAWTCSEPSALGSGISLAARNWSLLTVGGESLPALPGLSSPSSQRGATWLPVPAPLGCLSLTSAQTLSSLTWWPQPQACSLALVCRAVCWCLSPRWCSQAF